jgi:hypothetical protein
MTMALTLLAGVARADITPPIGIAHANWGAQTHERAAGIDLPLTVTALALGDGDSTSLIVDVDVCWLWDPLAGETLEAIASLTGLPHDAIRISYTHTHSAPAGSSSQSWVSAGSEMWDSYQANLQQCAAGAAWSALNSMQPVRLATHSGTSSISVNRRYPRPDDGVVVVGRNWGGIRDPEVQVFRFDTLEGDPLAAIVGFGCHPITVGPDNDKITPDYPGVVKQVVGEATGATTLFLQGAAGDVGPVRGVARYGANQYKRLGTILGLEAARLWWEAEPVPAEERYVRTLESGAPLALYEDVPLPDEPASVRVRRATVDLPVKQAGDAEALENALAGHTAELTRLRQQGGRAEDIRTATMSAKRASMRAKLNRRIEGMTTLPVEIYATAIGNDIALLAISVEMFAGTGLAIREGSPFPTTLVSGYTGPSGGYLPTADAYPLGGYEIEVSPYAPEAADVAAQAAIALLRSIRDEGATS